MAARIAFDGVWKRFRRGNVHDSLRDLVPALARRITGRPSARAAQDREFWALRDLSFEVQPGEVLGIIGPNGAGKSTTLKILNRIMDPTIGEVHVEGKMGSLIEVSAGFHQDLTGRQNVFLQGAIMGMRRAEVKRKFDEIVEFAGVADFIDTPVKRYSSGMNARLGFAIAAHLEPESLIIDEVLAVGDHAFQQRAFGRIKDIAKAGVPVVLVSHQLDRVLELCTKAILLNHGTMRTSGTPRHCIDAYLHGASAPSDHERFGHIGLTFSDITAPGGRSVRSGTDLLVEVAAKSDGTPLQPTWTPAIRVIDTTTGAFVHSVTANERSVPLPASGEFTFRLHLQMNLPPGTYNIEACIWDTASSVDVVTGPRVQVEVVEHLRFWGSVQLNTRWEVDCAVPVSELPGVIVREEHVDTRDAESGSALTVR